MKPIIEATELSALLQNPDLVLVDARGGLNGHEQYLSNHIKGAVFAHLDEDLSKKTTTPENGGRHPLPDINVFAGLLGKLGITPQKHVVVYDNQLGANASSRFWWMLKSIGHSKVQVLSGGLLAAISAGLPMSSQEEQLNSTQSYPIPAEFSGTISIEEVAAATQDKSRVVIDVRESDRYLGLREPLDLTAGHIPGAINIPFNSNLDTDGRFLSAEKLKEKYKGELGDRNPGDIIVHCGSGVTACHTLLALEQAGITGSKLYVGSWSEWSRTGRPIATSEQ